MAKEKQVKIPDKTTMNLYQVDTKGNNIGAFAVGLVIVAVAAFLIAQFAVIGRLNKLNKLESEVNQVQNVLIGYQNEMLEYPQVKEDYLRYSDAYSKDSEVFLDRIKIINLLEYSCEGLGTITSYNISNNEITLRVNTKSLDDFNQIKARLDNNRYVVNASPISSDDRSLKDTVVNVIRINVKEVDE